MYVYSTYKSRCPFSVGFIEPKIWLAGCQLKLTTAPCYYLRCSKVAVSVGRWVRLVAFRRSLFVGCFGSSAVGRLLYSLRGRLPCVDCCGWLLWLVAVLRCGSVIVGQSPRRLLPFVERVVGRPLSELVVVDWSFCFASL